MQTVSVHTNTMRRTVKNIEDNCYGNDLRKLLFELKAKHSDIIGINSFINLFSITLTTNYREIIADEYLDDFEGIEDFKNKELRARWGEYLSIRFKKEKKAHLRKAVFQYLDIYSFNEDLDYLIHSLRLIKTAKGLFKEELESIYEIGKIAVSKLDKPFLQKEILVELYSLFPTKTRADFEENIKKEIDTLTINQNYSGVYWLLEILKIIKAISKVEYKIMLAENYEMEGDFQSEDKKLKTYYPTILFTYQKGLRELKSISCDKSLRKRLENKVLQEQAEHVRMHSAISNAYLDTNKTLENLINNFGDSCITQNVMFDFHSGFKSLLSFPICLGSNLKKDTDRNYFLSQFFNTYKKIDSKGKVVGKTTSDEYQEIEDRRFWRECIINFLKKAKWRMDEDKIIERDTVYYYVLEKCNSTFIPEDRKMLFASGIYAGFNNDFVTSSHILVPQLENSLNPLCS